MKYIKIFIAVFIFGIITGCESNFGLKIKEALSVDPPYVPTVYVSGIGDDKPCYWIGNIRYSLPLEGTRAIGSALSIYATGESIYTTGNQTNKFITYQGKTVYTSYSAGYWKDASSISEGLSFPAVSDPLADPPLVPGSAGMSIFLYNSVIYTAGYTCESQEDGGVEDIGGTFQYVIYGYSHYSKPAFWKNGVRTDLDYDSANYEGGVVKSLYAKDSKIYLAGGLGRYYDILDNWYNDDPCYWISNGTTTSSPRSILTGSTEENPSVSFSLFAGIGLSIYSANGTIYIAGKATDPDDWTWYPYLWKTADSDTPGAVTIVKLSNIRNGATYYDYEKTGSANAITGEGSNIYIAGSITHPSLTGNTIPCIWINGAADKIDLPTASAYNSGEATGIAVMNSILYVSGYYKSGNTTVPCYWTVDLKNNRKVVSVVLETTNSGKATGIFLK